MAIRALRGGALSSAWHEGWKILRQGLRVACGIGQAVAAPHLPLDGREGENAAGGEQKSARLRPDSPIRPRQRQNTQTSPQNPFPQKSFPEKA